MTKIKFILMLLILGFLVNVTLQAEASSPNDPLVYVRDLTRIDGLRDNMLQGIGLVVGLNGSGDSRFSPTFQMLRNMLSTYGIVMDDAQARSRNAAAVIVTATLPPFAREGDPLDITVSSMGDAKSLQGGILLMTGLQAPNGQTYASAQGTVSIGGFSGGSGGNSSQQNHLLVGRVPNGGTVERTLEPDFANRSELDFLLNVVNFETATLISQAINDHFRTMSNGNTIAHAVNPGRVRVRVPVQYQNNVVNFVSQIERLQVRASMPAKIVINERTGTIVMGHDVRISTVAVAHGNLTITISTQVDTTELRDTDGNVIIDTNTNVQLNVKEEQNRLVELKSGATVGDVVRALNAIGASPRDIIAILQAIKEAGALYAQLEIM